MARTSEVEGLEWDEFLPWFRERWEPGDHFSLCALTKSGKTTFVGGVLQLRKYVLALDPKGGDELLGALGWQRLEAWPGTRNLRRMLERNNKEGKPSRYVVGPLVRERRDRDRLRRTITEAIEGAFDMGGWTLYVDELQVAADRRMMNLEGHIAELLVSARQPKRITVVSSFQAPAWVPSEAVRQPIWFAVSATRDEAVVRRLSEVMGRPFAELLGAMRGLEEHCFILVDRNPRSALMVTQPKKIEPRREAS